MKASPDACNAIARSDFQPAAESKPTLEQLQANESVEYSRLNNVDLGKLTRLWVAQSISAVAVPSRIHRVDNPRMTIVTAGAE